MPSLISEVFGFNFICVKFLGSVSRPIIPFQWCTVILIPGFFWTLCILNSYCFLTNQARSNARKYLEKSTLR